MFEEFYSEQGHLNPADRDEAYRNLAVAICAKAADDYIGYILQPDYAEEVEKARKMSLYAQAVREAVKKMPDDKAEEVQAHLLKSIREYEQSGMCIVYKHKSRWAVEKILKRLEKPLPIKELREIGSYFSQATKVSYKQKLRNSERRKREKRQLEDFFKSERFALYTGGLIDPDDVIARCEQLARGIRNEGDRPLGTL